MTLTIEVRSKPGKVNELYQTLQALLPTMRKRRRDARLAASPEIWRTGTSFSSPVSGMDREASTVYMRSGSGSALFGAIDLLGESARVRTDSDVRWGKGSRP